MADSALEALKQQLKSEDVKARRKACQQLGKLNDPAAIPLLVRVYKDVTEDPKVQEAAAEALKQYARKIPGAGASRTMKTMVYGLAGLLLILVLGNVAVRLGGEEAAPVVEQAGPTPREDLIARYETLLEETQADLDVMRQQWKELGAGALQCDPKVDLNRAEFIELSEIDKATYPDIWSVTIALRQVMTPLNGQVIVLYDQGCSADASGIVSRGTVDNAIQASQAIDTITPQLENARNLLTEAITNPIIINTPVPLSPDEETATAQAPTALPTEIPSETPLPTETATPGIVLTAPPGR